VKAAELIKDSAARETIKEEVEAQVEQYGWNNILVADMKNGRNKQFEGKTIADIADIVQKEPVECMLDLLWEEEGQVSMIRGTMHEEDVFTAAAGKLSMVGSDGMAIAADGVLARGKPHPRSYGTFPRVFAKFQREKNLFTLEQAVYKMTGAAAKKLNLQQRGLIKEGFAADIVLFDSARIRDVATYVEPHRYSEGIVSVYVNGMKAYDHGQFLDPKSGIVVRPG
jgi:N-acyl-D-amino-acid deacylase